MEVGLGYFFDTYGSRSFTGTELRSLLPLVRGREYRHQCQLSIPNGTPSMFESPRRVKGTRVLFHHGHGTPLRRELFKVQFPTFVFRVTSDPFLRVLSQGSPKPTLCGHRRCLLPRVEEVHPVF